MLKIVLKNSNVEKKLQLSKLESAILQLNKHKCRDCSIANAGKTSSLSES